MSADGILYFDDIAVGDVLTAGPYLTSRDEMVAFARRWHPRADYLAGELACPEYVRAVKQRLVGELGIGGAIIGAMGHDEIAYPAPARPGDAVTSRFEAIALRASRSRRERGIAKFKVTIANQRGDILLAYTDIIMMARRPAPAAPA